MFIAQIANLIYGNCSQVTLKHFPSFPFLFLALFLKKISHCMCNMYTYR